MGRIRESDEFGRRMQEYEMVETNRRLNPKLPIYARIDGRAFSTFTRDMIKPFDKDLNAVMIETTIYLLEQTQAKIGYTQFDEINLIWLADEQAPEIIFGGKIQKMCSVLASMAAAKFIIELEPGYRDRIPCFDCRVFNLPSKVEASNILLHRAMDCRKNAISAAALHYFKQSDIKGKKSSQMLEMLDGIGIDFEAHYPDAYKQGTFIRRERYETVLSAFELARIPTAKRPIGPVVRSEYRVLNMPPFNKVLNRAGVIFDSEEPRWYNE